MGYNSSTGILTAPFTKTAVNGRGDLQLALKSTSLSHTAIFLNSKINKWAKYQPFRDTRVFADRYSVAGSDRLAALKAANWGWGTSGIPSYYNFSALRSKLASGVTPGDEWKRQTLSAGDTLRALDFDGYASVDNVTREWGVLGARGRWLYFPFGGTINITGPGTGATVGADNAIIYTMNAADPDVDSSGLLFLNDFAGMAGSYYNYVDWYLGVLITPKTVSTSATSGFYIATDPQPLSYYWKSSASNPGLNVPLKVSASGVALPVGDYKAYPILCSMNANNGNYLVQLPTWGSENSAPGRMILIDGYNIEFTMSNTAPTGINVYRSYNTSGSYTIRIVNSNTSGVTFVANNLFAYVYTEEDFEPYDNAEREAKAISDWTVDGTRYTSGVMGGSGYVIGRYFDLYSSFYSANGNSNVLAAGKEVSVTINTGTSYQGNPYNDYAQIDILARVTINGSTSNKNY